MSQIKNTAPSYLTLIASLLEACDKLGYTPTREATTSTLPENAGWCFLRFGDKSAAALIISKTGRVCDVHVDASDLEGWMDLSRPNGRVMGHIDQNLVKDWAPLLTRLSGASKRAIKRASSVASQATLDQNVAGLLARLQTLGKGTPAVASPAPIALDSELDMLEEMSAELDA